MLCTAELGHLRFHMVTEEILLPTAFVTEWPSIGYFITSEFFFWLILLVSSSPSLTIPHSSSMNTNLGESSTFPILSISKQSSSSSTITFFQKGFNETVIFLKIKIQKYIKSIFANVVSSILIHTCLFL